MTFSNTSFLFLLLGSLVITSCSRTTLGFIVTSDQRQVAPATIQFENTSEGCESYNWEFGDGAMSTDSSPSHTYLLSGKYTVSLTGRKGKKTKQVSKEIMIKAPEQCLALIKTDYGDMLIQLFDDTPLHRDNFVKLVEEGFYDGLLFHRVINGFMIQGGDPSSKGSPKGARLGSGGPGYQIEPEFQAHLAHVKGALAAARMGDAVNPGKKSSGSQFYIVQGRPVTEQQLTQMEYRLDLEYPDNIRQDYLNLGGTPFLDQQYTVFGQVIKGLEVLDHIAELDTDPTDRPVNDVSMTIQMIK